MKNRLLLLLIVFLFNGLTSSAQSWVWGTEGTLPSKSSECEGVSVTLDSAGNSYLTGSFVDTINISAYQLIYNGRGFCMFIAKYDSNGNVLWVNQAVSHNSDLNAPSNGISAAADAFGNVYVAGIFQDTVSFGSFNLQCQDAYSVNSFLVKYDANGNVIWAKQSVGPYGVGTCLSKWVTTDKLGNVYITGNYQDSVSFGAYTLVANNTGENIFYTKYDSNGNVLWAQQPSLPFSFVIDYSNSIATDKYNNVYLTGYFRDSLTFGTTTLIVPAKQLNEVFIAKLDSNGNNLWAMQSTTMNFNGSMNNEPFCVTTDKQDNSYITGSFYDTINFGSYKLTTQNYQNIFLVKYDANGNVLWAKASNVLKDAMWASFEVATDTFNNAYIVAGDEEFNHDPGDIIVFGTDTITIGSSINDGNSLLVKFDSSGNVLCAVGINGGGDDENAIAVTPSGKYVYFGGDLYTTIRFGPDSLPLEDGETPFMAKWQPCSGCDLAVTLTPSQSLCSGQSVILTASGGANHTWSPSTGLSDTTGSSVIATPTATVTYTVTSGSGTCMSTDSIVITVIPSPNTPTFTQDGDTLISSSKYDNQWYRNDSILTNDTTQDLIITVLGEYWVIVNNEANGCSTASDSMAISTISTGINQLSSSNNQLSIYPNPTTGEINIISTKNIDDIKVTNLLGQLIYESQPKQIQFTFELKDEGMYFVTVTSDNETATKKVLVIK